ncbi:MAG: hypothetical protein N0E59_02210 [Candidatus Thiodiazotropha taylori]|nr:hypothetical protein [Candidatus Thiodiazotropha taylori]MCG8051920.1 hypothetical protein [Candidatus Thiodiazotropha taylori]MCG8109556.1 hypothetical protein [Candidatus Thiodiazotropha taylori]MCW4281897.1 hypothetical protein [Candidatus Thiodiazotropha taylori]MCW4306085.1 hypothetical protein [Candidatus Thiodiazotropha taylori]
MSAPIFFNTVEQYGVDFSDASNAPSFRLPPAPEGDDALRRLGELFCIHTQVDANAKSLRVEQFKSTQEDQRIMTHYLDLSEPVEKDETGYWGVNLQYLARDNFCYLTDAIGLKIIVEQDDEQKDKGPPNLVVVAQLDRSHGLTDKRSRPVYADKTLLRGFSLGPGAVVDLSMDEANTLWQIETVEVMTVGELPVRLVKVFQRFAPNTPFIFRGEFMGDASSVNPLRLNGERVSGHVFPLWLTQGQALRFTMEEAPINTSDEKPGVCSILLQGYCLGHG